ncbi:restriction endonuclease [candidate division KSB1 bacterium]|nr:MAG: restriction endonuclease [candidate division KSB1 bacterium]
MAPVIARKKENKKSKVEEAIDILKAINVPNDLCNEMTAYTLLGLCDLDAAKTWKNATDVLRGVTTLMDWMAKRYKKQYAPNTRESIRKDVIHHFLHAGLILRNPDDPKRPTNSGNTVYQLAPDFFLLIKSYKTKEWKANLQDFLKKAPTLGQKYAAERELLRVKVVIKEGTTIELSPGGQNVLVEKILTEFCEYFVHGAEVVYVGDTAKKWAHRDAQKMKELNIEVEEHGKIPDVIVYSREKNWLVLIEAVTTHGPISQKRRSDLSTIFGSTKAGIVYVTAFLDRDTFIKYAQEIAWETEVWIAENSTHLIHFNGERFLGPYEDKEQ